jgi:riboflavin synthase
LFTGIIQQRGKVVEPPGPGYRLRLSAPMLAGLPLGASVAVNGACLTVVETTGDMAAFDVVPETLERTTLGSIEPGHEVNLELPMAAEGRFDGHMVQGHVDGLGEVVSLRKDDGEVVMTIGAPEPLIEQIVEKGSIAVDGVSLTVTRVGQYRFDVALIPHTLEITTLGSLRPGDRVNLETDVIAKYVQRIIKAVR